MLALSSLKLGKRLRMLALVATLLIATAVVVLLILWRSLFQPIAVLDTTTIYEVVPGSSVSRVANELYARDYLVHPLLFRLLSHQRGVATSIKSGEYALQPGMSAADILSAMVAGNNVQYRLTLVEGWTVRDALNALRRAENIQHTLPQDVAYPELAGALQLEQSNPEGLLFPDTYFYTKNTRDIDLLRRANTRLQEVLNQAWETRLGALPFATPYEALILASIIEKESAQGSERAEIAGVFIRRLELGMRLQSDPTVIYGMGDQFDGDIRRADLRAETEYNTYRINGLPPTPIALAGEESIRASLNPAQTDALYFVSRGDGSHHFSSTLEEHNAAVNRYQRQPAQSAADSTQ